VLCWSKTSELLALWHSIASQKARFSTLNDIYDHSYIHFRSLVLFTPNPQCWRRCTAPKVAHNMTNNKWTIWIFTVHCQPAYWGRQLTFIETLELKLNSGSHTQPRHRHINISRIDLHVCFTVTHTHTHARARASGPKVLGLVFFKVDNTPFSFKIRSIGIYIGFCAFVQLLKSYRKILFWGLL
jgi:hypothetical protein